MPLHYILDGYNILNQIPKTTKDRSKDDLALFINELAESSRLKKQKVSLILDGFPKTEGPRLKFREGFEVLFSRDISADEKIRNIIENSKLPRDIIVVSDDREIRFFTKVLCAESMRVGDFLFMLLRKEKHSETGEGSQNNDKALSYKDITAINKELRKLWLGE